jgi:hypothetical protein
MSDALKITASHLARVAIVYLRQSSAAQVEHNRESTDRQYALVNKAGDLGWLADKIVVIDEDLGLSGVRHHGAIRFRPVDRRGRSRTRGSRSGP